MNRNEYRASTRRQHRKSTMEQMTPEQLELATLARVHGTVLEIGAGTGANFDDLPPDIHWIGLEPDKSSLPTLRRNARAFSKTFRVIHASAENIPLDDSSVDTVLSTFVLCSVDDPRQVLREVIRVLKPGGQLVFLEHVAAPPRTITRFVQRAGALMHGPRHPGDCDPVRDTLNTLQAAGFEQVDHEGYRVPWLLLPGVPHIAGTATRF